MTAVIDNLLGPIRRRIGGIEIIRDPVRTYADEWQVRDTELSPSELRTVRNAMDKLGIKSTFTPTGRYAEICLHECLERAILNATAAQQRGHKLTASQWWAVAKKARRALKQVPRQEAN